MIFVKNLRRARVNGRPRQPPPPPPYSLSQSICFGSVVEKAIEPLNLRLSAALTMEPTAPKFTYSVWALPPEEEVAPRLRELMGGLRSAYGGPKFEPHVTVVGAIDLTEEDAGKRFRATCDGLKAYTAKVDRVATGTFFYQCVFLLLDPTSEVVDASSHCWRHFGYTQATPYMPHLSLLYGDLSEEEKKAAQEKANSLDESIGSLSFTVSRLALYKTDTEDKTCLSWEKIEECTLGSS